MTIPSQGVPEAKLCPTCATRMTETDHGVCPGCSRHCGCSFSPTSLSDYCGAHRPSVSQPLPEAVPSAQQSVSMPLSEDVHRKEEKLYTSPKASPLCECGHAKRSHVDHRGECLKMCREGEGFADCNCTEYRPPVSGETAAPAPSNEPDESIRLAKAVTLDCLLDAARRNGEVCDCGFDQFGIHINDESRHPAGEGAPTDVAARITEYLSAGGLFNPEMMEHDKVRDLLIDCRAALGELASSLRSARDERDFARQMADAAEHARAISHAAGCALVEQRDAALSRVAELENQLRTAADMLEHEEAVNRGAFLKLREEVEALPSVAPEMIDSDVYVTLEHHINKRRVLSLLDRATTKDANAS